MLQRSSLLFIFFFTFFFISHAQFEKGKRMIGASIGSVFFNHGTTDLTSTGGSTTTNADEFGVSISPSYGWFINDALALGFSPGVTFNNKKTVGKASNGNTFLSDKTNEFGVAIGGFARYYFNGQNKNLRCFGQYNLNVGIGGTKTNGFNYETYGTYVDRYNIKSSGNFFANTGAALGLSKFLNQHAALDFFLGYTFSYTKSSPTGTSLRDFSDPLTPDQNQQIKYDQKYSNSGVVFGLGLQVFLDPAKKK